jgi:hypothetical protein
VINVMQMLDNLESQGGGKLPGLRDPSANGNRSSTSP